MNTLQLCGEIRSQMKIRLFPVSYDLQSHRRENPLNLELIITWLNNLMADTKLKIHVVFVVRNITVRAHFVTQSHHGDSVCAREWKKWAKELLAANVQMLAAVDDRATHRLAVLSKCPLVLTHLPVLPLCPKGGGEVTQGVQKKAQIETLLKFCLITSSFACCI